MDELIITVASTGGKWKKIDSPYVPMTPEQIIEDVIEAFEVGASLAHIHARDEEGNPSFDPKYFTKIIDPIRKRCPILIQISTGHLEGKIQDKMVPLLKLKPDMASLNIKGPIEQICMAAEIMKEHGVKPVIEAFDVSMIETSKEFIKGGILEGPLFYEMVFDREREKPRPIILDVEDLVSRIKAMPKESIWSITRGGDNQLTLGIMATLLGGHVRVGLEDNLYLDSQELAKSSSKFVHRIAGKAKGLGRKIASVDEARKILKL